MKKLNANEMRNLWFSFWKGKEHEIIESASLIPQNDPTLLWINAGVAPLKKYFDGSMVPNNRRMASSQKCIRTNDIENVGKTARHQTFFEMLGNFSIGDYFKKEAITWAWEFLTSEEWLDMDPEKLYITIYPTDKEAHDIWLSCGVKEDHIIPLEDNFWEIGPGPSGPDSEIFYDRGQAYDKENLGIQLLKEDMENDRYIEIWNNVFSQYNAKEGVLRSEYKELPSKNIDTGMGLERIISILQEVETNFETDLFLPIMKKIEELSKQTYEGQMSFKVIADHVRSLTFALADGASFGNTGRDYVLRRLLRRAVRHGKKLGINHPFMAELVPVVISIMEEAYSYLRSKESFILKKMEQEEILFSKTLNQGEKRLQELIETATNQTISGQDAFKLYDTYGFPLELTKEIALEQGFFVDQEGFEICMKEQQEKAKQSRICEFSMQQQNEDLLSFQLESNFVGYEKTEVSTKIIALFDQDHFVDTLKDGYVVLEQTPFYVESGGQVSDSGSLLFKGEEIPILSSFKGPNGQVFHYVKTDHELKIEDLVVCKIDCKKRKSIARNHSAAHLLQSSLRQILGSEVHQAGSRVDENDVRFDFTYDNKITKEQLYEIETFVNKMIKDSLETKTEIMELQEAKKTGAMALFDEKYGNQVRVVTMGDSKELCGGTHVKNTSEIERFAIASLESKGNNVYRITGATAGNIKSVLFAVIKPYNDEMIQLLEKAKRIIKEAQTKDIALDFHFDLNHDAPICYKDIVFNLNEVNQIKEAVQQLTKDYQQQLGKKALESIDLYLEQKIRVNEMDVLVCKLEQFDLAILKQMMEAMYQKMDHPFIFLANVKENSVNFLAKSDASNPLDCGALVKEASLKTSGNGGGSKVFAQGGGNDITQLDSVLEDILKKIESL